MTTQQPAAPSILDAAMILKLVADARYLREKARADYLDAERGAL